MYIHEYHSVEDVYAQKKLTEVKQQCEIHFKYIF